MNIQYGQLPVVTSGGEAAQHATHSTHTQPETSHASLSAHEQRELDDLIRSNYDLLGHQQMAQQTSSSDSGHEQTVPQVYVFHRELYDSLELKRY